MRVAVIEENAAQREYLLTLVGGSRITVYGGLLGRRRSL